MQLRNIIFNWDDTKCRDMFVLGFIHDIGYEFSVTQQEHPVVGGQMLRQAGYQYWKTIHDHGDLHSEPMNDQLLILNYSDLTTSRSGDEISAEDRLDDVQALW